MKAEKLLEELRAQLDIADVISDYLELKRAGQNYKGICPFHSEKTPSFIVSPDKQIFHCFGCNAGGDIIAFVMKYENLSFHESLKLLAKKAGIDLKEYRFDRSTEDLRGNLIEIHKEALKVFAENLKKSKHAFEYIKNRGVTEETIRIFSLGYALKDWHCLCRQLKTKGFPEPVIVKSGIAASGEKGLYDIFRDRIIFPICDAQGDIIAFGGRVMDDSQPKYLNSPDTAIFRKGDTLYGLNLAKDGIRKKGNALIVEGYLDVMACHQYGFPNTVAPLGTALTSGHLQRLKRFTKRAVLVFDGDEAGKAAARRSLPILFGQGFDVRILVLPEKEDPDSFLKEHGGAKFGSLLTKARTAMDFILSSTRSGKTETIHEGIEIISAANDIIMKEELIRDLAEKAGLRETVIREEIKKAGKRLKERLKDAPFSSLPATPSLCDEEFLLLSIAITFPDRFDYILKMVSLEEFRNITVRNLLEKLRGLDGAFKNFTSPAFSDEERTIIRRLTIKPGFDLDTVDKNIEDCIKKIIMRRFDKRLRHAEQSGDLKLLNAMLLEKQKLLKEGSLLKTGIRLECG